MNSRIGMGLGIGILGMVLAVVVVSSSVSDPPVPPAEGVDAPPARPAPVALPLPDPAEPDLIGKPGFFHLERQEGTWWLIDPDGARFVSIGMNHLEPALMVSPLNREQTLARYGAGFLGENGAPDRDGEAVGRWMQDSMKQVRSWGFNTLGMHNPVPQSEMPYVATFRPAKIDSWQKKTVFPDPFDPATAKSVDEQAAAFCKDKVDDRLILGYGFNDWVNWHTRIGEHNPWLVAIMKLPAKAPGKQAWIAHLQQRYPTAAEAARAYGVSGTTWEQFAAHEKWPPPNPGTQEDTAAFLPRVAHQWYSIVSSAVRRHDPNHLILGDKLDGFYDFPEWMDAVVDESFDLAYLQWFRRFGDQQARLDRFYASTGKPVLVGDSGFSTPSRWLEEPKPIRVASSQEVGREYAQYLEDLMRQPYAVGWHWCGYIMGSPELLKTMGLWPSKQYGFLDPDGTPHAAEIRSVKAANAAAAQWHTEAEPFDPARVVPAPPPRVETPAPGPAAKAKTKAKVKAKVKAKTP